MIIKVRISGTNRAVSGIVPIDDQSDIEFAEFLINAVKNEIRPARERICSDDIPHTEFSH